ncbi:MAG: sodium-coupled permease [Gemmataceae bacterium]|nr:sodium-coupled permease [Gemmataceae bacterium]
MDILDYLVIGGYAVAMLAVGRYYKAQALTADDYLLGGRRMNPFMIGLSLFATLTSTLSYLAYPGEIIKNGPMMFAQLTAFPVVMLIVGWVLIPRIMREEVTSGYELLELRLGLVGRLLGAGMFMALRTVWMAAILYATSNKVLVPLLEIDPMWSPVISATMGIITLIYSAEGGMRAVVVTDAMQSVIMFAGAIVIVVVVSVKLDGVAAWWPTVWPEHWQEPVFWFRADVRVTFMGAFLNMVVWMTCTAGADQMAIQRYLSTRDAAAARRSFGVNLLSDVVIAILLALAGLAVLAYFTAHPDTLAVGGPLFEQADELLPRFVVTVLPAGLSGLVIAAMLSAAMSSLSSGMNSASAVITTDFIGRFRREKWAPHEEMRVARWASVGIGLLAVFLSMFVGELTSNLLELCIKVVNLLTAPLFVLFFLALFVPRATPLAGVAATVAGVGVAVGIAFFKLGGLEFLWTGPAAFVTGVVVGSVVSLLPLGPTQPSASAA